MFVIMLCYMEKWRLSEWAWPYQISPWADNFVWLFTRMEVWDSNHKKYSHIAGWKMKETMWQGIGVTLRSWEHPQMTAIKESETTVQQPWENDFCQQQEWFWKWNFPQSFFLEESSVDVTPTPWFQPCETLNREHSHAMPDLWPTELWVDRWV